jgi:hypothetical protein
MDDPGPSIDSHVIKSFLDKQASRSGPPPREGGERHGQHGGWFWQALASGTSSLLKTALLIGFGVAAAYLVKSKAKDILDHEVRAMGERGMRARGVDTTESSTSPFLTLDPCAPTRRWSGRWMRQWSGSAPISSHMPTPGYL